MRLRIYEVPVSYHGRTYDEGKKIGWKDGVRALYCIVKYGVRRRRSASVASASALRATGGGTRRRGRRPSRHRSRLAREAASLARRAPERPPRAAGGRARRRAIR